MKKSIKAEINEALDMLFENEHKIEDCCSFINTLTNREVKQLARAVEKQFNHPCRKTKDGLDLRVQLKIALMEGFVPVL